MIGFDTIILAALAGIIPSIIWLAFWLREDTLHPEPNQFIILTFILGIVGVLIAVPLEYFTAQLFTSQLTIIIAWSFIEESLKFLAGFLGAWRFGVIDEPVDALIYMITPALGFAAFENLLFLIEPFSTGDILAGFITGNIRFLGASLLHTLTSSIMGVAFALAFYRNFGHKVWAGFVGLFIATALHAVFNFFILSAQVTHIAGALFGVWVGIIALLIIFEKIKRLHTV